MRSGKAAQAIVTAERTRAALGNLRAPSSPIIRGAGQRQFGGKARRIASLAWRIPALCPFYPWAFRGQAYGEGKYDNESLSRTLGYNCPIKE
jgi:hypothetical protein